MGQSEPDFETATRVHLMGICGSGMGAFAGMLQARGMEVRGSDQGAFPPMSTRLAEWGIEVMEGYRPENLDWNPDLVIVGNVIRQVNPEATAMRERGLPHMSFPDALGSLFLQERHPIVVTGTHGKTTTTSLTSWLLAHAGHSPGFLVGGIPANFGKSFQIGEPPYFVIEGDEYDTAYFDKGPKFLHYRPQTVILTSIEFDHADIYRDLDHVVESFEKLMAIMPPDGTVMVCGEEPLPPTVAEKAPCKVMTYGFGPHCDWRAVDARPNGTGYQFILHRPDSDPLKVYSPMAGQHNVLNTLGALGALESAGIPAEVAAEGLPSFLGVGKRQEVKGEERGVLVIDDYAHHPTAVEVTISAIRDRYPGRTLWALFEAESNTSRRRVFQDRYPEVLAHADRVILAKPLKKNDKLKPEEQIDVGAIVDTLNRQGTQAHHIPEFDDIVRFVAENAQKGDVILAMSGRNFGGLHDKLLKRLREE